MYKKITLLDKSPLLTETLDKIQSFSSLPLLNPEDQNIPIERLIERTNDAELILVSTGTRLTREYFEACPSVHYVGICGTSTALVDIETLKEKEIQWSNVSDYGDEPTAEYIFMQLTALARGVGQYQWKEMPRELMGKRIGVIGLGALGKAIARLALAYKMDAGYYSIHRKEDWERQGLTYFEHQDLIKRSEIIILSTPTNVQALGRTEFNYIQPNSILIQASIGNPFDKEAFFEWIKKEGNFAIFDAGIGEENMQLYKNLPRIIVSNNTSGYCYETRIRLGEKVIENIQAYLSF